MKNEHFTSSMKKIKKEPCPDCAELRKKVKRLEGLVNSLLVQSKTMVIPSKPNDDPDIREVELDLGEPVLSVTGRRYGEG